MIEPAPTLRLALDQNFPTPLMSAVNDYLPVEIEMKSLRRIDPRLSELDDRALFLALHHLGWHGLITNNYKMLDVPAELAAIVRTQAVVVAVEGLGHDPLRAVGALLLELPGLSTRVVPRRSNVFRLAYRRRMAEDARMHFQRVAERRGRVADDLWQEVLVSDDEFAGLASPKWPRQLRFGSLELLG